MVTQHPQQGRVFGSLGGQLLAIDVESEHCGPRRAGKSGRAALWNALGILQGGPRVARGRHLLHSILNEWTSRYRTSAAGAGTGETPAFRLRWPRWFRPGARRRVPPAVSSSATPSGAFAGSVSGGCVEVAVIEAAAEIMQSVTPRVLEFGVSDELAMSVGTRLRRQDPRLRRSAGVAGCCEGTLDALIAARDAGRAVVLLSPLDGSLQRLLGESGLSLLEKTDPALAAQARQALLQDRTLVALGQGGEVLITPHNPAAEARHRRRGAHCGIAVQARTRSGLCGHGDRSAFRVREARAVSGSPAVRGMAAAGAASTRPRFAHGGGAAHARSEDRRSRASGGAEAQMRSMWAPWDRPARRRSASSDSQRRASRRSSSPASADPPGFPSVPARRSRSQSRSWPR